jgi:hypothetical protein
MLCEVIDKIEKNNSFLNIPNELINLILEYLRIKNSSFTHYNFDLDTLDELNINENIRTKILFNLSYTCKEMYERLLNDKIIMRNCPMTLKNNRPIDVLNISSIVYYYKPSYQIRNLCLKNNELINDEECELLKRFDGVYFKIYHLNLSECRNVSENSFKYLDNIEVLETYKCVNVSYHNKTFMHLKNLKELSVTIYVRNNLIKREIFTPLKELKKLVLIANSKIDENIFDEFANLEHLHLTCFCTFESKKIYMIEKLKKIKNLILKFFTCRLDIDNFHFLKQCKSLNFLHLEGINYQRKNKSDFFHQIKNVEKLSLNDESDKLNCKNIAILTNLKQLDVSWCDQNDITNNSFKDLKKMKVLKMNGSFPRVHHCLNNEIFKYLKNLSTLEISGCNKFSDDIFKYLNNLNYLDVSNCKQLNGKYFYALKKLRHLDISNTSIGDESFTNHINHIVNFKAESCQNITTNVLKNFRGIEGLDISHIKGSLIRSEDFQFIENKLKVLKINDCTSLDSTLFQYTQNLIRLDMECCIQKKMSGQNFKWLKNLKHLNMSHCIQSTIHKKHFLHLKKLNYIDVAGCDRYNNKFYSNIIKMIQLNNKKEKKYEELKKSNPFVLFIFESIDYIIPFSSNFCNFSD